MQLAGLHWLGHGATVHLHTIIFSCMQLFALPAITRISRTHDMHVQTLHDAVKWLLLCMHDEAVLAS